MTGAQPLRGEIWWTKTGTKSRPVVVISRDAMNRRLNKVLVLPGTTNLRGWPDEVILEPGILKEPTAFCCREVTPVAIAELTKRAGIVSSHWLSLACATLATVFDCPDSSE